MAVSDGPLPDVGKRIKALKARGGQLVWLCPRRTEPLSRPASICLFSPGTDVACCFGLLHPCLTRSAGSMTSPALRATMVLSHASARGLNSARGHGPCIAQSLPNRCGNWRGTFAAATAPCATAHGCVVQRYGRFASGMISAQQSGEGNLDQRGGACVRTGL